MISNSVNFLKILKKSKKWKNRKNDEILKFYKLNLDSNINLVNKYGFYDANRCSSNDNTDS